MNFAHSEVATLDPNTMRTLCEEYVANNYIDPETSERLGVKRGLRNPDGSYGHPYMGRYALHNRYPATKSRRNCSCEHCRHWM